LSIVLKFQADNLPGDRARASRAGMSRDRQRLVDYLAHMLEAIGRINRYTEDLDELCFPAERTDSKTPSSATLKFSPKPATTSKSITRILRRGIANCHWRLHTRPVPHPERHLIAGAFLVFGRTTNAKCATRKEGKLFP